ncbi:MAG: TonB-dependent receptor [Myxococcota bacterium]
MQLLALLAAGPAYAAEVTGQIRGTVTDADGLGIPGVTVKVSGPNYIGGATVSSNADGDFRFPALPPGEYTVEANKDGFLPYKATGLLVVTGGTSSLDVVMKLATPGAELTVEEVKPTVDVQNVRTGAVLTRETLRDIPNRGRSYQSATALAPGVTGGANPNVRGAFEDSNQFYVDGLNNTDPTTGTFSQNMNFDAIEEVQVITGGMDAEYGRALGGAINVVTRSGGNKLHGDATFLYSNNKLQAYEPLPDEPEEIPEFYDASMALNLGGPVMKDKLWFFVSVEGNLARNGVYVSGDVDRPADEPVLPAEWRSAYWFAKLTWRANDKHQIAVHGQGDPTYIENVEEYYSSVYTLSNGETIQEQGGWMVSASHLFTPNPKSILHSQVFFQESDIDYYSVNCKDQAESMESIARCTESLDDRWLAYDPDGFNAGSFPYSYSSRRKRASLTSSFTQFADLLGEHQIKVGVQGEYLRNDDQFPGYDALEFWTYAEDNADLDSYTPYMLQQYDGELGTKLYGFLISAYLQDVWNPIERLTVRPGVRMDHSELSDDSDQIAYVKTTFSPRFGLAFDVTNDGKTNAHAYYGRFYDSGFLLMSDLLHKKGRGYQLFLWDEEAGDWGSEPVFSQAAANPIHSDIDLPWSDEFDVGVARDLGNGWAIDGTFTYEYAAGFWEDDEINLVWNADGTDVIGYRNGTNEAIYRVRTAEDVFVEYTSFELAMSRQFDDGIGILGSYTWSRAWGNKDEQNIGGQLDNPEQAEEEIGLLPYDRTHQIKLLGSARKPDLWQLSDNLSLGLLAGWNFIAESGAPYRPSYYDQYNQGWYLYGDQSETDRLPMYSRTDLKAGVTVKAGKTTTFDVTAECFNVFNDRTVVDVNTAYGNETGDGVYVDENGDPIYGTPIEYQAPRYFQFGVRGEF